MERVPASAPGPKTATKSRAQISEFTEREATKMNCASQLRKGLGVKLRAARKESGTAIASARIVPRVAM